MKNSSSLIALWISLISNVILTVLKSVVGYLFNSQVLIADGIHNAMETRTLCLLYSTRKSTK
ncbi:cation efflux family protein [Aneurinibacillus soli]|uniref:Cation efflux family protein n=1 Tax=Aneurinibacillus soli TaxID=1500254 RepID=A0A0U5AX26_9BACL|nr:cation transporter [Aneurinibacillus soli]PYE60881.1 cation efflux family protein [Aneurinibacillus soli]BAU26786.1 Cation efflux family protein [Aneurinibacillus soli]